jgi:hypothetical protein
MKHSLLMVGLVAVLLVAVSAVVQANEPLQAAERWPFTYVSRWPAGGCNAVAAQGGIVFFDRGGSLQIGDFTDPLHPDVLGWIPLGDTPEAIALQGRYAYVAGADAALRIIDIINLTSPTEVGSFESGGHSGDVAISGNYAYLAGGWGQAGVRIVDVSDPTAPVLVGSWTGSPAAVVEAIKVSGNRAYLACQQQGLRILDISNPAAPVALGGFSDGNSCGSLDLAGNYACLTMHDFVVVDVTDPLAPTEVGRCASTQAFLDVVVADTLAYTIGGFGDSAVRVVDISDPAHPQLAGYGPEPFEPWHDIAVDGSRLYGAISWGAVKILGLDNPVEPQGLGVFGTGPASAVAAFGEQVYLADGLGGLSILDVGAPSEPRELSCVPSLSQTSDVAHRDHYAFLADGSGGFRVLDVADPSAPIEVARKPGNFVALDLIGACAVAGNLIGISNDFTLFDITNPANPIESGWLDGPINPYAVTVHNGVVYMTGQGYSGAFELWAFDMAGGCGSVYGTGIPIEDNNATMTNALGVAGDVAYIGMNSSVGGMGLVMVDVSDPSNPQLAGFYEMDLTPDFIACDGNTAYAGPAYPGGTLMLDVTNPLQPIETGVIAGPGAPTGVVSQNGYLYISDRGSGLWIFRDEAASGVVPTPPRSRFTLLGNYPNPSASGTMIRYELPQAAAVELGVFDQTGRRVRGLKNGVREGPGLGQALWDGCDELGRRVATGTYFYQLTAGERTERGRISVVR